MLDHMATPYLLFEEMPDYFSKELVPLCIPHFIFKFPFWTTTQRQASTTMTLTCQGLSFPMGCSAQPALGLLPLPRGNPHKPSKDTRSKKRSLVPFPRAPAISRGRSQFFYTDIVCMRVTVGMLMPWYTHGGQRTTVWSQFLPPFCDTASPLFLLCALDSIQSGFQPVLPASYLTLAVLGVRKHTIALAFNRGSGVQT